MLKDGFATGGLIFESKRYVMGEQLCDCTFLPRHAQLIERRSFEPVSIPVTIGGTRG